MTRTELLEALNEIDNHLIDAETLLCDLLSEVRCEYRADDADEVEAMLEEVHDTVMYARPNGWHELIEEHLR